MFKKLLLSLVVLASSITTISAQNALDFDGTNDFVQTTYSGISGTSARTIEAWIKTTANSLPTGSGGTGQKVIVDYGSFTTGGRFTLNLLWSNSIRLEVGGNGISGTLAVNDGNWHHVAAVFNPSSNPKYRLYIDGVLNVSGNLTVTTNTATTYDVMIGQRVDGSGKFDGAIDEVRIWNVARTATEIQNTMNSEFCVIPTSLKAYYKANQGTASGTNTGLTTLNDNSGNSNNGTLSGFSLSGSTSNWVTGATLTSGNLTGGTASVTGCIPYTTLGNQVLTIAGTYPDTFVMPSGCDSIYTINFLPLQPSFGAITTTECDAFTGPSGTVYDSTGVYLDTTVNAIGCDSIITLNLTINNSTSYAFTTSNCLSYTSPSGSIYTTTGIYMDTIPNGIGCDSILTIDVTIFNGYYVTLNALACDAYTSPSGKTWTTSGTYFDTVLTGTGCDSLFTINLTLNQTSAGTVTETACDEYISDNGNTYTSTGTYTEIIGNASGCDSIITLNLTIIHIDSSVTGNGNTLTAVASGLNYRWLDCDDNYSPISGGNQQSYTPSETGNYAVKITDGSCVDTSFCNYVVVVGINDFSAATGLKIYPNPASSTISIRNSREAVRIEVLNVVGQVIKVLNIQNGTQQYDLSNLNSGLYFIRYTKENQQYLEKLIIEK